MIRSFYGWFRKTEKSLRKSRSKVVLPESYQTTVIGAYKFSQEVLVLLKDTEYEARSKYWNGIFESIINEGWKD